MLGRIDATTEPSVRERAAEAGMRDVEPRLLAALEASAWALLLPTMVSRAIWAGNTGVCRGRLRHLQWPF
jgi:hypothetical protein